MPVRIVLRASLAWAALCDPLPHVHAGGHDPATAAQRLASSVLRQKCPLSFQVINKMEARPGAVVRVRGLRFCIYCMYLLQQGGGYRHHRRASWLAISSPSPWSAPLPLRNSTPHYPPPSSQYPPRCWQEMQGAELPLTQIRDNHHHHHHHLRRPWPAPSPKPQQSPILLLHLRLFVRPTNPILSLLSSCPIPPINTFIPTYCKRHFCESIINPASWRRSPRTR